MKIIKLYASWCGPCRVLEQTMQECNIKYENIDVDTPDGEGISLKYGVSTIPTILILDDNDNLLKKSTGNLSKDELTNFIYATN